jgi:vacuolar protein sorting-associated protein 53
MAALLSKAGKDLTVTDLLDALQQTKDFELSMAKKFGASVGLSPLSEKNSF